MTSIDRDIKKAIRYQEMYCPNCGKKIKIDLKKRKNKCPKCKFEITVKK